MSVPHVFPGIHLQLTVEDKPYLPSLKPILNGRCRASVNYDPVQTSMDGVMRVAKNGHHTKYVATTSEHLLRLITRDDKSKLDDFAGSIINFMGHEHLFLKPLKQLQTVSYGKFLAKRYLNKFLRPGDWFTIPEFKWKLFEPSLTQELLNVLESANFCAIDIENNYPADTRCITCVGFSAVAISSEGRLRVSTYVVPFTDEYNIQVIRQACATKTAKVFQNGKFDNAYLLRFGIPVTNYLGDTINLFHSWYSELPKSLAQITSFCLRDWTYWKDEAAHGIGSYEYYQYNAKDCFTTAMDFLVLMLEMPEFAMKNYEAEFPVVFPCILSEMTGLAIDEKRKDELAREVEFVNKERLKSIQTMVGSKSYNPNSPKQTLALWKALGSEDIKSTDKVDQDKVKVRHPINRRIVSGIIKYREFSGALSKYVGKDFVWNERCYYALNPHGTDTGRLASRESAYNCGLQIQNIKRDSEDISVKDIFVCDPGFYLGEADYKQNESWGTAYLSGDKELIRIVEDVSRDFHALNASKFFGVPYADIVRTTGNPETGWLHKTLDKALRDLSKRVNHGANYNMAANILLDTMGIDNVIRAQKVLCRPRHETLLQTCQYLLDAFDTTFPIVRGANFDNIRAEVASTGMLVGPTGWTRVCFSDPNANKRGMNMYAAHKPQSLAAMVLNKAYVRVFNEVWMSEPNDFKLHAQIHDSILFSYRIGRDDLPVKVAKCMDIHTDVRDIFGVSHDLNVPVDLKGGSARWSELKGI